MDDSMLQEKLQLQRDILTAKRQLSELRQEIRMASAQCELHEGKAYPLPVSERSLLIERLVQDMSRAQREKRMVAVLMFNLASYRQIRDEQGAFMVGVLLHTFAEQLRLHARAGDTVAYMGEDEFGLVMPDLDSAQAAADFAVRLTDSFVKTPLKFGDQEVSLNAAIGIALYPLDGVNAEILLRHAGLALYHASIEGGVGSMQYYSDRMSDTVGLTLEDVMQRAFECGEFVVQYAPVVSVANGRIAAMEALLYWQSPERGRVAPREFVPQLEKMGLILPVGAWMLDTVCRQIALWLNAGLESPTVSVNLAALQIRQRDYIRLLQTVLQRHGLEHNAGLLELDVSENLLMQDVDVTAELFKALKGIGVNLGVADFGTGHSCLSYLKYLPIDTLKIDPVFVRNLPHSREDAAIIKAILTLGQGLGLKVVFAGVDAAAQLDWLQAAGCRMSGSSGRFDRAASAV